MTHTIVFSYFTLVDLTGSQTRNSLGCPAPGRGHHCSSRDQPPVVSTKYPMFVRQYQVGNTGSRQITEFKQLGPRLTLGGVTIQMLNVICVSHTAGCGVPDTMPHRKKMSQYAQGAQKSLTATTTTKKNKKKKQT